MGIFYDPTKPAANDKPSNDQSPMQMNFASIKTLIDVDHVDFDNALYGEHNQVTFAANKIPAIPTTPPVLFTNNVAGLAQLFYYTGDTPNGSPQYTTTALTPTTSSGSTMALGGIIIKWGKFTDISGSTVPLTYSMAASPISAFPNATLVVIPTVSNTNLTAGIKDGSFTASGFTLLKSNSAPATIFFIALGY